MRMRRLSDRARLEGMLALRKALDGVRRGNGSASIARDDSVRAVLSQPRESDASTWLQRAEAGRGGYRDDLRNDAMNQSTADADPTRAERDIEMAKALDRIADSIERIGAQLDSYHHERAEHLDAIEFLLREMVISTVPATAARSAALGGVVDPDQLDSGPMGRDDDDISIIPDGYPLEVDTEVEVRSRFHDRWISGFSIAESVDSAGRCRYRLTRRSDGIPLPILFEACDVRAASSTYERQPLPVSRASVSDFRRR
jgi:hypothetical protein